MSALVASPGASYVTPRRHPRSRRDRSRSASYEMALDMAPASQRRATAVLGRRWPETIPTAYNYARSQLVKAEQALLDVGEPGPSEAARSKMLDTLREVLAEDSVYPTVSIDEDGGVTAEWRIAHIALEVDCDPEGVMVYSARLRGQQSTVGTGTSTTPLRGLIRELSSVVEQHNPNWRALFRPGAATTSR